MRPRPVVSSGWDHTIALRRADSRGYEPDPAALADSGSFLYFNERADERLISDSAAIKIDRLNNGNVITEVNVDDPGMLDLGFDQNGFFSDQGCRRAQFQSDLRKQEDLLTLRIALDRFPSGGRSTLLQLALTPS